MRSLLHLLCTLFLGPFISLCAGRTSTFDASDARLAYSSSSAWSTSLNGSSTIQATTAAGASLAFSFAGQQVVVLGSSVGAYRVTLDGTTYEFSSADSQLFRTSGLDAGEVHGLVIARDGLDGEEMVVTRVKVAYSDDTNLVPSLVRSDSVPASSSTSASLPTGLATDPKASSTVAVVPDRTVSSRSADSLSTFSIVRRTSTSTSEPSSSPSLASSSLSSASQTQSASPALGSAVAETGTPAGSIAGAVIGSLAGLALLVILVLFLMRRRKAAEGDYYDADTGRQRGSGAFTMPPPILRAGSGGEDGGVGSAPRHATPPSGAGPTAGEGWAARLARNSSWRRRAERLPATRAFYGVTSEVPLPNAPPPNVPPPRLPPSAVAYMAEAHPPSARKPILLPRKMPEAYASPPASAESTVTLPISLPTRSPSRPQRYHIPTGASLRPSVAFLTTPPKASGSSAPTSPSSAQESHERTGKQSLESSVGDHQVQEARLEQVEEEGVQVGEEDRPHYFQLREVMPKYSQARGDPRAG